MTKKSKITPFEERILEGIGRRIADAPIMLDIGMPKTDGHRIWLPMTDTSFSFYDLEGLMGHEGGHIRFRSIINQDIYKMLCKENPAIGRLVMNIFEDARVNFLLRQTYPGYYDELMKCNERFSEERALMMSKEDPAVLDSKKAIDFIFNLTILYGAGNGDEYIYHEALRNEDGSFKFKSKRLGNFWKKVVDAFETMYSYFTYSSSVLASKIFIDALRDFINDDIEEEKEESEGGSGRKEGSSKEEEESEGTGEEGAEAEGTGGGEEKKDGKEKSKKSLKDYEITENPTEESSESGVTTDKLNPKSAKRLEEMVKKIIASKTSGGEEFEDEVAVELSEEKKEMEEEIKKIKSEAESVEKKDDKTDVIFEGRDGIKVDVLRDLKDIKNVNGIRENTSEIYGDIIRKNNAIIHSIRIKLNNIRQSKINVRGARKGIISYRDLPQVVASRGRFDKPFINRSKGKGAYLVIVIDESGSMLRGKIEMAKESAIILAESLKGTRIQYSVIGFGAVGGENRIVEKVYKSLDEELFPEKLGAIGCSDGYCENRDGTSFKGIAKHHLRKLQGGVPMMIIISDGSPYHGGTEYVGDTAEKDTAKTVAELKKNGICMFALSLDYSGASYLKDIYGINCFHVVNNASELRDKLIFMVENLVNAVK